MYLGDLPGGLTGAHIALRARAEARRGLDAGALYLRDKLFHRAAGGRLDDDEIDHHDAEQGRDNQQQAADDIGEHGAPNGYGERSLFRGRLFAPGEGFRQGRLDPPAIKTETVFRGHRGPRELVPIGHPEAADMPLGDHVVARQQHPVEGA